MPTPPHGREATDREARHLGCARRMIFVLEGPLTCSERELESIGMTLVRFGKHGALIRHSENCVPPPHVVDLSLRHSVAAKVPGV